MSKTEDLFNKEGAAGVQRFRDSLEQNNRNATRATTDSIAYTVETTGTKIVLEIRAVGHPSIQRLEDGFSAAQAQAEPPNFEDIVEWTRAKGFGDAGVAGVIFAGIVNEGWNEDLPNRTGKNGGTDGILSDPRKETERMIRNKIRSTIKADLLEKLKTANRTK